MNSHHQLWHNPEQCLSGQLLANFIIENNLFIINDDSPTYQPVHRSSYKRVLDLAICNEQLTSYIDSFQTSDQVTSDHVPILVKLKSTKRIRTSKFKHTVKTTNWDKFQVNIRKLELPTIDPKTTEQIDQSIEATTKIIQQSITESTTSKEITINSEKLEIIPKPILDLIKQKRRTRRKLMKKHRPKDKIETNRLTAKIRLEHKKHKQKTWREFCNSLNGHSVSDSKLWKAINSIDNQNKKFKVTKLETVNKELTSDPVQIANIFANHMQNVFTETNHPTFNQENYTKIQQEVPNFFNSNTNNTPIDVITPEEVALTIRTSIGTHGAPGDDQITNKAIKHLPEYFYAHLTIIFNASLQLNHVPDFWKKAIIVMIPKPLKDHSKPGNHRPISLLNTLSKLLERLILTRILSWLTNSNLISQYQAGFRKGRQTKDQILRLVQDGIEAFNKRQHMTAIFIDIEKAFDKVWINGLLYKLHHYNIPNYLGKWLQCYLTNRSFQIKYNQTLSTTRSIQTGVPQGSVLGPVLFIIFFNDVVKANPHPNNPKEALFADDVALWIASGNYKFMQIKLQERLNEIQEWMSIWRTLLSVEKTHYTIFNKAGLSYNNKIQLTYNNQPIQPTRNFKFLGVTLDPALNFHAYAKAINERAQKRLNILRRIKGSNWGASPKLILTSYKVLIRPIIEYAPFIPLAMSDTSQTILQRIQNSAIRIATKWPMNTTTEEMNNKVNLELLTDRASKLSIKYISKAYVNNDSIHNLINDYNIAPQLAEGLHSKGQQRDTIIGLIKKEVINFRRTNNLHHQPQ